MAIALCKRSRPSSGSTTKQRRPRNSTFLSSRTQRLGISAVMERKDMRFTGRPAGTVMTVEFQIEGKEFIALNGGPQFKFTEAVSFSVECKTQEEMDELWKKLTDGGEEGACGWLKDKYGLSWQINPTILGEMLQDKDRKRAGRVMEAMLKMKKIDIRALKKAYEG